MQAIPVVDPAKLIRPLRGTPLPSTVSCPGCDSEYSRGSEQGVNVSVVGACRTCQEGGVFGEL
jgi:hypothetical protein